MPGRRRSVSVRSGGTVIRLTPGRSREHGWSLSVDGVCQSYVDVSDPDYIQYGYVRRHLDAARWALDSVSVRDRPTVLHVGGGALTLPRALAHSHPGSRHVVCDPLKDMTDLVLEVAPLRPEWDVEVHSVPGDVLIPGTEPDSVDLLMQDAHVGDVKPDSLGTPEYLSDAARALTDRGVVLENVLDYDGLDTSRRYADSWREFLPTAVVLAGPRMFSGASTTANTLILGCARDLDDEDIEEVAGLTRLSWERR